MCILHCKLVTIGHKQFALTSRSDVPRVIDSDPEFTKVLRYLRPSDYLSWGISTAVFPGLFTVFEHLDPVNGKQFTRPSGSLLRVGTLFGFVGGFFIVYNKSSKRFFGVEENAREVAKDRYEVKKNLSKGLHPFGSAPRLSPWLQEMSMRNSKNSQFGNFFLPWFSFFRHDYHNIDLKRYYEIREGEDKWGIELPPYDTLEKKVY
ncbi:hypothetical protein WICMUC_004810 [Wickerhamomyces mucosus]|uniref:NADH-ubiquinone oxidoreductase 21kDa subunit N-terminal domain-containing protein n=1 Tax=Wickerhamomyces mucosus TaxID=1378264 RepID=A0A9P8PFA4_9ASCO|nr:hypothetical protein WICMUC_004810 [Wickerhamomyces mucosus]